MCLEMRLASLRNPVLDIERQANWYLAMRGEMDGPAVDRVRQVLLTAVAIRTLLEDLFDGGELDDFEDFDHAEMAAAQRHFQWRWERIREEQQAFTREEHAVAEAGWRSYQDEYDAVIKSLANTTHPELVEALIAILRRDADYHSRMAIPPRVDPRTGAPTSGRRAR